MLHCYNTELAAIPYHDLKKTSEGFYRALFLVMLRAVGITVYAEIPTKNGRSDLVVETPSALYVLEFKLAQDKSSVDAKRVEGEKQIADKNYGVPFGNDSRTMHACVIVIDASAHVAYL